MELSAAQRDWHALLLFIVLLGIVALESRGLRPLECVVTWGVVGALVALLAWQWLHPASYSRARWLAMPATRLLLAARLVAVDTMRTFGPVAPATAGGFGQLAHLLLSCVMSSGICTLCTVSICMLCTVRPRHVRSSSAAARTLVTSPSLLPCPPAPSLAEPVLAAPKTHTQTPWAPPPPHVPCRARWACSCRPWLL
jgi:hypothetical protein